MTKCYGYYNVLSYKHIHTIFLYNVYFNILKLLMLRKLKQKQCSFLTLIIFLIFAKTLGLGFVFNIHF